MARRIGVAADVSTEHEPRHIFAANEVLEHV